MCSKPVKKYRHQCYIVILSTWLGEGAHPGLFSSLWKGHPCHSLTHLGYRFYSASWISKQVVRPQSGTTSPWIHPKTVKEKTSCMEKSEQQRTSPLFYADPQIKNRRAQRWTEIKINSFIWLEIKLESSTIQSNILTGFFKRIGLVLLQSRGVRE